jgi:hypothetical protein
MSVEDKERVEKLLEANRKQWRIRKRLFKEAWDTVTESMPGKPKELMVSSVREKLCNKQEETKFMPYRKQLG